MNTLASKQRGVGLMEPLIGIVILAFGLLGLAKFQLGMVSQTTDAQTRLSASGATEDLLTQVRVDLANLNCYRVPTASNTSACTSPPAMSRATAWEAGVKSAGFAPSADISATNPNSFTVTLTWTDRNAKETRTQTVTTDVRP